MTLEQLEALLAALPTDDQAPLGWPQMSLPVLQERLADLRQRRRTLDHRLSLARNAQRTIGELSEPFVTWHTHLNEWRRVLCAELLALPPRIRDKHLLDVQRSLDLSIQAIDFGLDVLEGTGLALADLRVGELIAAAGYAPGVWHGSLPELEQIAARRAAAQSALDDTLLDDDVRAEREAEAKELRDAYNGMRVKGPGLVVWVNGAPLEDESVLSDVQRRALARAREALLAETVAK